MEKIDEVLSIFQKEMKAWLDNPASHAFWGSCQEVNDRAMTDKGSGVFIDAIKEMTEEGVELVLRSIKAAYMGEYFELSGEVKEGKEHDGELTWLLAVGDTFLQILADKAGEMGGDACTIQTIIGKSPRGGAGLTTEESIIQGCQTGTNRRTEQDGELLCILPERLKTDKALKIFQRAIDAGMMEKTATGLKWLQIGIAGGKTQLAYFCGKLCDYENGGYKGNVGDSVSYEVFEKLFNVTRLDRALAQCYEARKPQWWREKIDALFY